MKGPPYAVRPLLERGRGLRESSQHSLLDGFGSLLFSQMHKRIAFIYNRLVVYADDESVYGRKQG